MKKPTLLIDELYRASFRKEPVMGWKSNVEMRKALVSARRFVLDDAMSTMLGDLASAAFAPLKGLEKEPRSRAMGRLAEQLRVSARLPFETVWIEYNLRNAQVRSTEILGESYHPKESPRDEGWLLRRHPYFETAIQLLITNRGETDRWTFPIAYAWSTDETIPPWRSVIPKGSTSDSVLATGIGGYHSPHVTICESDLMGPLTRYRHDALEGLVREWVGVLRRCWALLATINDIPILRTEATHSRGFVAQGRYRKYLDCTTITLRVPQDEFRKIARKAVAAVRRRAHEVRGHWRKDWRNPGAISCKHEWQEDQTCRLCHGHRLWIREHERGDPDLGIVAHHYRVEIAHDGEEIGHENAGKLATH